LRGAGAAGTAVTKMLLRAGIGDIAVSDSKGRIHPGRDGLNPVKAALAEQTNRARAGPGVGVPAEPLSASAG
jgi:malate dehydrogenase (oxaloacetate-decarboxylating)